MPRAPRSFNQVAGLCLLSLGCVLFAALGIRAEGVLFHSRDIQPVYAGARCLVEGCNSYNADQIRNEYIRAGGTPVDPQVWLPDVPIYFPTAFTALLPLAWLPWSIFHPLWIALTTLAICAAAFAMADLCRDFAPLPGLVCISFLVFASTLVIMLGQPVSVTVFLIAFAVWASVRRRFPWLAALAFAWALAFKPQMAAFLFLWLLLQPGFPRRVAWRSLSIFFFLSLLTLALCVHNSSMVHWAADLAANLRLASAPGHGLDATTTSPHASTMPYLQPLLWLVLGRWAAPAAICISLLLAVAWFVGHRRASASAPALLVSLAAISSITFLPVYHREYDVCLLLLAMPAVSVLAMRGTGWRWSAFGIAMLAIVLTWHKWAALLLRHVANQSPIVLAAVMRPAAWGVLLLSLYFVAALWSFTPTGTRDA